MSAALKINREEGNKEQNACSNLLFRTVKPASTAGFRIDSYIGDTVTDTKVLYRDVRVNTTGKKWFVEFKHWVPLELRKHYGNRRWVRIKMYKGINVVRTMEWAEHVKRAVIAWLRDGYSPFEEDIEAHKALTEKIEKKSFSIQQALHLFETEWKRRDVHPKTMVKYKRALDRFIDWLRRKKLLQAAASTITGEHIEQYLYDSKAVGQWTNTTFNAERGFIGTIFNHLHKKGITAKIEHTKKLRAKPKKHRYFDERTYNELRKLMIERDPYLYFACECVYYLCLRSEDELKQLKVGNIRPENRQVLINGKTGERIIPLVEEMQKIFESRKILDADADHFVFSVPAKNKFLPDGKPGPEPFGSGFFSKRFARIRKLAGISGDYTVMGFRHTRVIHLKTDGVPDADIMSLTGHTTYEAFGKYLRDLGLTANTKLLSEKTRKI